MQAAVEHLRPGMTMGELDTLLRDAVPTVARRNIIHNGHGIGTGPHESPRVVPGEETVIREGMVLMLEPGAYEPGVGGVRLEWMYLVTATGNEVLSGFPHAQAARSRGGGMTTMVAPPHADPVTEGARIAQAAEDAELELRVVGGVAVALRCASSASPPLSRTYKDVDVAGRAADRRQDHGAADRLGLPRGRAVQRAQRRAAAALLRRPQPAAARRVPRPRRAVPQDRPAAAAADPRRDAPARRPAADEAAGGRDQRQGLHATWPRCSSISRSPTMTRTRSTSTTCAGSPAVTGACGAR